MTDLHKLREKFEYILSKKRADGLYEPDLTFDNWNEKIAALLHAVAQERQDLRRRIERLRRDSWEQIEGNPFSYNEAINDVLALLSEQSLTLSSEDSKLFLEALRNPPEPSKKLKRAYKRYKKQVVSK